MRRSVHVMAPSVLGRPTWSGLMSFAYSLRSKDRRPGCIARAAPVGFGCLRRQPSGWLRSLRSRRARSAVLMRGATSMRRAAFHGIPPRGFTSSSCRRIEQILPGCKQSLEGEGIACGKLHRPSRKTDHLVWRFYVAAGSQRDFVFRVGSWHPRKRSLLAARFDGRQPG
jgi:hypothetical protein